MVEYSAVDWFNAISALFDSSYRGVAGSSPAVGIGAKSPCSLAWFRIQDCRSCGSGSNPGGGAPKLFVATVLSKMVRRVNGARELLEVVSS